MIKETFTALKAIGVSDQHILDIIVTLRDRDERTDHQFFDIREEIHELKKDVAVLKWATVGIFALLLPILFKVFSK